MNLLLFVLVLFLFFGGGGFYFGGPILGATVIGLLLMIGALIYFAGGFRSKT